MSDNVCEVDDLLDIGDRVRTVQVVGSGMAEPVPTFTDGLHVYFDDATTARVGAHLTGRVDLAGRPVHVDRSGVGWREHRGLNIRSLHHRHVAGSSVFRFDDEWLFTVVEPVPHQRRQGSDRADSRVAPSRAAGARPV